MAGLRRSGRITKEIPIVLVGTDLGGMVFSEETKTILLSRHGAGILSRHKISPEGVLTLRLAGTGTEAEIRLVGPMGNRPDGWVFGVAFQDSDLDFWELDFPPALPVHDGELDGSAMECSLCHEREIVHQSDVEIDVYAVNECILRYCDNCGLTTNWSQAGTGGDNGSRPSLPSVPSSHPPSSASDDSLKKAQAGTSAVSKAAVEVLELDPAPVPATAARPAGRQNRRRDVRIGVTYMACLRHPAAGEEIVECDNISKGGFSFRSQKHYTKDSMIEVSLPYSPGSPAIFVSADIKHVEELPGGDLFRYGAAYAKASTFSRIL
jgi:hypothetical protein